MGLQVDGFRWDIMGHLMMRTMERVVQAVRRLTIEADGVNGSKIQQYAEAWSFGEVFISPLCCILLCFAEDQQAQFQDTCVHCSKFSSNWLGKAAEDRICRFMPSDQPETP